MRSHERTVGMQRTKDTNKACQSRRRMYMILKRAFDVVFSGTMLVLLFPLFLFLAVVIAITSHAVPIYRHCRAGRNGKKIYVLKFRTMVKNADQMVDSFTDEQKAEWYHNYRLEFDPRVTRVGRVLRKTKLDELPQFLNTFLGDMSVVGPRPITEEELQYIEEHRDKLLSVTPGMTGYWQAYAPQDCTYEERIRMELAYVDGANVWWDVKIIFATIRKILRAVYLILSSRETDEDVSE